MLNRFRYSASPYNLRKYGCNEPRNVLWLQRSLLAILVHGCVTIESVKDEVIDMRNADLGLPFREIFLEITTWLQPRPHPAKDRNRTSCRLSEVVTPSNVSRAIFSRQLSQERAHSMGEGGQT